MARLTRKTFREALINSGGNQARIAEKVGLGKSAVSMFLKRHPDMRIELNEEADRLIEWAEDNVAMSVMIHKDISDSKWLLANSKRGKAKGYGQKSEVELSGNISTLTKEEREAEIKRLLEQ